MGWKHDGQSEDKFKLMIVVLNSFSLTLILNYDSTSFLECVCD